MRSVSKMYTSIAFRPSTYGLKSVRTILTLTLVVCAFSRPATAFAVVDVLDPLREIMTKGFSEISSSITLVLSKVEENTAMMNRTLSIVNYVSDTTKTTLAKLDETTGILHGISTGFATIKDGIVTITSRVEQTTGLFELLSRGLDHTISVIYSIGNVTATMPSKLSAIESVVKSGSTSVASLLTSIVNVELTVGNLTTSISQVHTHLVGVSTSVVSVVGTIPQLVSREIESLVTSLKTPIDNIGTTIDRVVDRILQAIEVIPTTALSVIDKDLDHIVESDRFMNLAKDVLIETGSRVGGVVWDKVVEPRKVEISILAGGILTVFVVPFLLSIYIGISIYGMTRRLRGVEQRLMVERRRG